MWRPGLDQRKRGRMTRLIRLSCGIYGLVHAAMAVGIILHCIVVGLLDRFLAVTAIQLLLASAGARAATVSPQKTFSDRLLGVAVGVGLIYDIVFIANSGSVPAMSIPLLGSVSVLIEFDAAYRLVRQYSPAVALLPWVLAVSSVPVILRLLGRSRPEPMERTGYF